MTVRELIAQLIEYDTQDAEVKIVYLPEGSADIEYLIPVNTYAAVNSAATSTAVRSRWSWAPNDGDLFIAIEVEELQR